LVSGPVDVAAGLDSDTILAWLEKKLAFDCQDPTQSPTWSRLAVTGVRALLPENVGEPEDDTIAITYGTDELLYPVRKSSSQRWVYGPMAENPDTSPLQVSVLQEFGAVTLSLELRWTVWSNQEGAGFRHVRQQFEKLTEAGWELSTEQHE
jgi:hypothetical protein